MRFDDKKYNVYNTRKKAGSHSSYIAMVESIQRKLLINCSYLKTLILNRSKTTDSTYFFATFKDHHETLEFSLRNHAPHESYTGSYLLMQKYKDEHDLYDGVCKLLSSFNDDKCKQNDDTEELSVFGSLLIDALSNDGTEQIKEVD